MGLNDGARRASVELYVDQGRLDPALSGARSKIQRWGGKVSGDIKSAMRGAFDSLKGIAGFGGIAGLAIAGKQVLEFETRIARLGVSSRSTAAQMAALKQQIFDVASRRGISATDLLAGMEKFVALTGDIGTAGKALDAFGEIAQATGSNVEEIATTAAALSTNLGIAGEEMTAAFGTLLAQGKSGAIELKDMAQIAAGLTPQFSTFGRKGTDALTEMGAALQIMRSGFGSANETATGLQSLMTAMVKNAGKLQGLGVKVFEVGPSGQKTLRDFSEIAFDLIEKSKGDPRVLQKILGRQEAYAALLPMMQKGRAEFDKMIAAGKGGADELNRDFKKMAETPAFKMAQAKAQIERTFNELLAKNLTTIAKAFQAIADAIKFISDNPSTALALLAAWKGGGYLGGFAGSGGMAGAAGPIAGGRAGGGGYLGGFAGSGGMAGAAGPIAGGRAGALLGHAGAAAQGAAVGHLVANTLGSSLHLPQVGKVGLELVHALAMIPGPAGAMARAVALAADGIMLVALKGQRTLIGGTTLYKGSGLGGVASGLGAAEVGVRQGRESAFAEREFHAGQLLEFAAGAGALKPSLTGAFGINEEALDVALASDKSLSAQERAEFKANVMRSAALTGEDVGFRRKMLEKHAPEMKVKVELQVGVDPVSGNLTVEEYRRKQLGKRRRGR